MSDLSTISAIVLAGGKGTRMKSQLPKVLHKLGDKTLIEHTIATLNNLNLGQIIVVTGHEAGLVKRAINNAKTAHQNEQLGTGHAVQIALPKLPKNIQTVLVINGDDSAFYKVKTLQDIIQKYIKSDKKMTIVTSILENAQISGRVIRDKKGSLIEIRPNSKMTPEELASNHEVVCGLYLFDRNFLEKELPKVEPGPKGEYNITTLIDKALKLFKLLDIKLKDPLEFRSVNTQEELENARKLWRKLK